MVGEQAQEQLAFRGQPGAVAVAAERLRDAGDHADLTRAVKVAPALGGLAGAVGCDRFERESGMDARHHLGRRQHLGHAPAIGGADVHVFDEAQHRPCAPEVLRHRQDFMVVGTALDHHVHLDRAKTGVLRGGNAFQHLGDGEVDIVHAPERRVVEGIQADGDALQAGRLQRMRLLRQQGSVGGQREVERLAVGRAQFAQHANQDVEVLAQQRLAAGEPELLHAVRNEDAGNARDLFETEQRALRQEAVLLVEYFLGHAVAAAEIAAVGHRNAQVAQRPAQAIAQQTGGRRQQLRNARHG